MFILREVWHPILCSHSSKYRSSVTQWWLSFKHTFYISILVYSSSIKIHQKILRESTVLSWQAQITYQTEDDGVCFCTRPTRLKEQFTMRHVAPFQNITMTPVQPCFTFPQCFKLSVEATYTNYQLVYMTNYGSITRCTALGDEHDNDYPTYRHPYLYSAR